MGHKDVLVDPDADQDRSENAGEQDQKVPDPDNGSFGVGLGSGACHEFGRAAEEGGAARCGDDARHGAAPGDTA